MLLVFTWCDTVTCVGMSLMATTCAVFTSPVLVAVYRLTGFRVKIVMALLTCMWLPLVFVNLADTTLGYTSIRLLSSLLGTGDRPVTVLGISRHLVRVLLTAPLNC